MRKTSKKSLCGVVLAAGKGTRMKSELPKVLHQVAGYPMLRWVLDVLIDVGVNKLCVIVGGEVSQFDPVLKPYPKVTVCVQKNRRGTADAVAATAFCFEGVQPPNYAVGELVRGPKIQSDYILISAGDTPALNPVTLKEFIDRSLEADVDIGILGMENSNPTGYGRLVLDEQGRLLKIVEEKDADEEIKKISLCNSGVIFAKTNFLFEILDSVSPNNIQKEYYLTDCFELAHKKGKPAYIHITKNYEEFNGINDQQQLLELEKWLKENRGNKVCAES